MAPRHVWAGSIAFGLVNVPVTLCTAVTDRDIKFSSFTESGHPVGQQMIDKVTADVVEHAEIRRGWLVGDRVVLVDDAELAALAPEATKTILIDGFVDGAQISPLFYGRHHYAVPAVGGETAYGLLLAALAVTGKVGVGHVVMRSKEHLVAVRTEAEALTVTLLNYADEVRVVRELDLPGPATPDKRMLDMTLKIIKSLTCNWDPAKYHDGQRARVAALMASKSAQVVPGAGAKLIDLNAALKASLVRDSSPAGTETATSARAARTKKALKEAS